jgi:hypothetical protein
MKKMKKKNEFDVLFELYFGSKKKIKDLVKRITDIEIFDNKIHERIDVSDMDLGEPDEITQFKDGIFLFNKMTWHTDKGTIVRVEMVNEDYKPKSLQEQLDEALLKEDYDKAIKIRDLINKKNEK